MNIEKARKILGKVADEIEDNELIKVIDNLSVLASIFIDQQKGIVNYEKTNLQ